jgi:hypothetical protein
MAKRRAVLVKEIPDRAEFMAALESGAKGCHRPVSFFAAEMIQAGLVAIGLMDIVDTFAPRKEKEKNDVS